MASLRSNPQPPAGRLPDFLVIGATKAGTTSFDFFLSLHPDIHMARPKEPRFFIDAPQPIGAYRRGLDWYRSLFTTTKPIAGETTPAYAQHPFLEGVPERVARHVPDAKIIYLVRNPWERLRSHYVMLHRLHRNVGSFASECLRDGGLRILPASRYGTQLELFLRYFGPDRILVLESEDLQSKTRETMCRAYTFLGVDPDYWSPSYSRRKNVSARLITPNEAGRRLLASTIGKWASRVAEGDLAHPVMKLVLRPFSQSRPCLELPDDLTRRLDDMFASEVAKLRTLTGAPLPSLGYPA